jgi:hypothetical protein
VYNDSKFGGLADTRPWLKPRQVHAGLVVDKVAQVFQGTSVFPHPVLFRQCSIQSFRHVCVLVKRTYYLCHVCLSAWMNSAPTGWIYVTFDIGDFHYNLLRNWKFGYSWKKSTGIFMYRPKYRLFLPVI